MSSFEKFKALLPQIELTENKSIRHDHGVDESFHSPKLPVGVVFPKSTEEVAEVVKAAVVTKTALIPFGAGTSLEGHIIPKGLAVSVDMSRMDRVLATNPFDLDCRVQAGILRGELNRRIKHDGLFFPVDPGADCTIGGMVATRASGTNSVMYGTIRENILGLTVVTAEGKIIKTGGRARKSAAGYDLTHLYCGSEGTLGFITEVQLRLYGLPEAAAAVRLSFDTVENSVQTVVEAIQMGLNLSRAEFLDKTLVEATNNFAQLSLPVAPSLWVEFQGTEASVKEQVATVLALAEGNGCVGSETATEQAELENLWHARHEALYALMALRPGTKGFITDACVPISHLAEQISQANKALETSGLKGSILGHVGDGNFHTCLLVDSDNPEEIRLAETFAEGVSQRSIACGGTCTGEHGIGSGKKKFMELEHGEGVGVMRAIKQALDPHGIMNPGKVFSSS